MVSRILAALAALLSAAVAVAVVVIPRSQGSSPAWWFIALVLCATVALGWCASAQVPRRGVLLGASGLLQVLGVLAVFSVGLLLVLAAAMGLLAALRAPVRPVAAVP